MASARRLEIFAAALAFLFVLSMLFANHLWTANRLYPLTPAFHFLASLPSSLDLLLSIALIFLLVLSVIFPARKTFLIIALALIGFLFLRDEGRMFPSFYEYFLLLFIIAWHRPGKSAVQDSNNDATAILNICRLAIALIYIWAGIEKLNPLFVNDFSWFTAPITSALPWIGAILAVLLVAAPLAEIAIGVGLFFKSTRNIALWSALLMHAGIFFLIGPFRGNWNDSAWAWNLGSAVIVFVLFFRADDAALNTSGPSAKDMLFAAWRTPAYWVAVVLFGIMPAFGLFNLWDSALSFDVYSGNYVQAQLYVTPAAAATLPAPLARYADPLSGTFNIDQWSLDEFNAHPYPAARMYKNILRTICLDTADPSGVHLIIHKKVLPFESPQWFGGGEYYDCAG